MSEIKIYLKDWSFNAGVVGFMSVFGDTVADIEDSGINVSDNFISFDSSLLEGFGDRYRKYLIRYFLTDNLLDKQIEVLESEEAVSKLKKTDWEKSDFKVLYKIFENLGISTLDDLKVKHKDAASAVRNAKDSNYFDDTDESDELITSRFINYVGRNAVQPEKGSSQAGVYRIINTVNENAKHLQNESEQKGKNICVLCGNNASKEYTTSVNVMGGKSRKSTLAWFNGDIFICPMCEIVYFCMLPALSKSANGVYYFANINTSVKRLFEYNSNLKSVEIEANALLSYIERIKELAKLDIERREFSSFQFIKTDQNGLIGNPGYNLYQYHITPEIVQFLSKYQPPSGRYAHDQDTWVHIYEKWLEKALAGALGWADAGALFYAGIGKKISNVQLSYTVRYISEYRRMIGGNMDKEEIDVIKWGRRCGAKLKGVIDSGKVDGLAYTLLGALKTENINEFLNSYMRAMMSYDVSPTFPTDLLKDNEKFIQFGYAFLAGLLQGDSKEDKKDNNTAENV